MEDEDFGFDEQGIYREKDVPGDDILLDDEGIWRDDLEDDRGRDYSHFTFSDSGFRSHKSSSSTLNKLVEADTYSPLPRADYREEYLPLDERSLGISELEASVSGQGEEYSFDRHSVPSDEFLSDSSSELDFPELRDESYLVSDHSKQSREQSEQESLPQYERYGDYSPDYDDDHSDYQTVEDRHCRFDIEATSTELESAQDRESYGDRPPIVGASIFSQETHELTLPPQKSLIEFERLEAAMGESQADDAASDNMDLIGAYLQGLQDQQDSDERNDDALLRTSHSILDGNIEPLPAEDRLSQGSVDELYLVPNVASNDEDSEGIGQIITVEESCSLITNQQPPFVDFMQLSPMDATENDLTESTHSEVASSRSSTPPPPMSPSASRIPMLRSRSPSMSRPGSRSPRMSKPDSRSASPGGDRTRYFRGFQFGSPASSRERGRSLPPTPSRDLQQADFMQHTSELARTSDTALSDKFKPTADDKELDLAASLLVATPNSNQNLKELPYRERAASETLFVYQREAARPTSPESPYPAATVPKLLVPANESSRSFKIRGSQSTGNLQGKPQPLKAHAMADFRSMGNLKDGEDERQGMADQDLDEETMKQLQIEYNSLLKKYAQAENIIDQMRLGAKVSLQVDSPTPGQAQPGVMPAAQHAQTFSVPQTAVPMPQQAQIVDAKSQLGLISHRDSASSHFSGADGGGLSATADPLSASIAGESTKLSLFAKAKAVEVQTNAFQTLLEEDELTLEDQEKALQNVRDGYNELHQEYRTARDEHAYLERQGLLSPDLPGFDDGHEVEAELYQLDKMMDGLEQTVKENLKEKTVRVPYHGSPLKADHSTGQASSDKSLVGDRKVSSGSSMEQPRRPSSVGSTAGGPAGIDRKLHKLHKDYSALMDRYRKLKQMKKTPERDQEINHVLKEIKRIYELTPDHRKPALPPELEEQYNAVNDLFVERHRSPNAELDENSLYTSPKHIKGSGGESVSRALPETYLVGPRDRVRRSRKNKSKESSHADDNRRRHGPRSRPIQSESTDILSSDSRSNSGSSDFPGMDTSQSSRKGSAGSRRLPRPGPPKRPHHTDYRDSGYNSRKTATPGKDSRHGVTGGKSSEVAADGVMRSDDGLTDSDTDSVRTGSTVEENRKHSGRRHSSKKDEESRKRAAAETGVGSDSCGFGVGSGEESSQFSQDLHHEEASLLSDRTGSSVKSEQLRTLQDEVTRLKRHMGLAEEGDSMRQAAQLQPLIQPQPMHLQQNAGFSQQMPGEYYPSGYLYYGDYQDAKTSGSEMFNSGSQGPSLAGHGTADAELYHKTAAASINRTDRVPSNIAAPNHWTDGEQTYSSQVSADGQQYYNSQTNPTTRGGAVTPSNRQYYREIGNGQTETYMATIPEDLPGMYGTGHHRDLRGNIMSRKSDGDQFDRVMENDRSRDRRVESDKRWKEDRIRQTETPAAHSSRRSYQSRSSPAKLYKTNEDPGDTRPATKESSWRHDGTRGRRYKYSDLEEPHSASPRRTRRTDRDEELTYHSDDGQYDYSPDPRERHTTRRVRGQYPRRHEDSFQGGDQDISKSARTYKSSLHRNRSAPYADQVVHYSERPEYNGYYGDSVATPGVLSSQGLAYDEHNTNSSEWIPHYSDQPESQYSTYGQSMLPTQGVAGYQAPPAGVIHPPGYQQPGYQSPHAIAAQNSGYQTPHTTVSQETGYLMPHATVTQQPGYQVPHATVTQQPGYHTPQVLVTQQPGYHTPHVAVTQQNGYQAPHMTVTGEPVLQQSRPGQNNGPSVTFALPDNSTYHEHQYTETPTVDPASTTGLAVYPAPNTTGQTYVPVQTMPATSVVQVPSATNLVQMPATSSVVQVPVNGTMQPTASTSQRLPPGTVVQQVHTVPTTNGAQQVPVSYQRGRTKRANKVRYYVREYGGESEDDVGYRRVERTRRKSPARRATQYEDSDDSGELSDDLDESLNSAVETARVLQRMSEKMRGTLQDELTRTYKEDTSQATLK